jgi:hypothetical protein
MWSKAKVCEDMAEHLYIFDAFVSSFYLGFA